MSCCLWPSLLAGWGAALRHGLPQGTALPCGQDARDQWHGLLAARALWQPVLGCWFWVPGGGGRGRVVSGGHCGACWAAALLHALPRLFGGGVVVAVVAHGAQFGGLHMAQVALHELDAAEREGALARLVTFGSIFVAERDVRVADGLDAAVANHAAEDVAPEVFDGVLARAEGLHVDAPTLAPHTRITAQAEGLHLRSEVMTEHFFEGLSRHEVVGLFHDDVVALLIESGCWHDAVQMRMEEHLLVPGVQDHGERAAGRAEPLFVCQGLAQGASAGVEERVIGTFCLRAKEQVTQLGWKCERDHKIRCGDELALLSPHPLCGGGASALRTAFVMATVIGVVPLARARGAAMHMPAHDGGAAVLQRPDGTVLHAAQARARAQIGGQEPAQRVDDRGHPLWQR